MQINLHGARLNRIFVRTPSSSGRTGPPRIGPETGERRSKTDVFPEPSAEANKIRAMPRRENDCKKTNHFVKPSAIEFTRIVEARNGRTKFNIFPLKPFSHEKPAFRRSRPVGSVRDTAAQAGGHPRRDDRMHRTRRTCGQGRSDDQRGACRSPLVAVVRLRETLA